MTNLQRTAAEIGVGVLVLVGVLFYVRADIRRHAVIDFKLAATEAKSDTLSKIATNDSVAASRLAQEAATQKARANVLVAKQMADSARQDSLTKVATNERDEARRIYSDSQATVGELRGALGEALRRSVADSARISQLRVEQSAVVRDLLNTIAADSVALSAEQSHARSLEALNASLRTEIALVKQSQPSKFGGIVKIAAWSAGAFVLGRITK